MCIKKIFLLSVISLLGTTLFAQETKTYRNADEQKLFESAKSLFEERLYGLAYERLTILLTRHPGDLYIKYLTGICGIYISDKHDEGLEYLTEVKTRNPRAADVDYYFALLYHKTYQFDKCIDLATALLFNPQTDPKLKTELNRIIENCKNGKELVATMHDTRIGNIGGPPNTEGAEYSPVISPDEEMIFYTYRGKLCKGGLRDIYDRPDKYGFYYEDIYMSRKVNGSWQPAESLENINTESNEAVLAMSNDGQQLYIFRANETDGGDIYMSQLEGDKFGIPEKLQGDINTNSWEGSITLSGDQKKAIFSSERPGGFGGKDLYEAVRLQGNTWGHVKNLGDHINTPYDDDAPCLHPDGRSLVFSSKGHNSMGDFDIFLSELNAADSSWKNPVNVGYPINTTDDDIYYALSADGKRGYFASAKTGGHGDKDIYVEEPVVFSKDSYLAVIKGKTTENLLPYSTDIAVYYAKDDRNYGIFRSNSASGNYLVSLPSGQDYKISYYHPVLGEKVVHLNTEKRSSYSDTLVNVNFGLSDTTPAKEPLVADNPGDKLKTGLDRGTMKGEITLGGTDAKTSKGGVTQAGADAKLPVSTDPNVAGLKKMTRAELLSKYGDAQVSGLQYIIQLGAYRHPENFNDKQLQKVCTAKRSGTIKGDINLITADKKFDTWREADTFLGVVKKAGQKDAFLTAIYFDKRYYMKDLVDMGVWLNSTPGTLSAAAAEIKTTEEHTYGIAGNSIMALPDLIGTLNRLQVISFSFSKQAYALFF